MDETNLGSCCACGKTDPSVRNILCLPYETPEPGTGWGCFTCGLPANGAVAVVCDACLVGHAELQTIVKGLAARGERIAVPATKVAFEHDKRYHREYTPTSPRPRARVVELRGEAS